MVRSTKKLKVPLVLLLAVLLVAPPASAYVSEPGYVPLRRTLPNAIDLMETSLYWMQDMAGVDDPRDPAAIIALMEDQAARFFDVRMPTLKAVMPRRTGTYTVVAGGEFYHRGGPHIRLLFHFYLSSKGWRIYDVTSNGVSAVAGLRRRYFNNRFDR
jgi:hypothetical protein